MKKTIYRMLRFCAGGAIGVMAYYIALYTLTEWAGVWYVISAVVAYVLNFTINFLVQKFWTFKNKDKKSTARQLGIYFGMDVIFLVVTPSLLYLMVEYGHLYYLEAQAILTIAMSIPSYFVTQWIFKSRPTTNV